MVFVKALGFLDLFAAIMIVLGQLHVVSWRVLILCAGYLLIKGIMFFHDVASKIDIAVGMYCVVLIFKPFILLTVLGSLYLTVKALFSFAA